MNDATKTSYENAPATELVASACAVCARPLADAESVNSGLGPHCRKACGIDARSLFPRWEEVKSALGADEYETLQIDKLRPLYNDHEVAKRVANRLVYRIAAEQTGPRTQARTLALHALGYEKLATKIADRLGAVHVIEEEGVLVVKAPKSEAFISAMRSVPGSRWVGERRARLVPVASKRSLWGAIKTAFPGALVVGKRLAVA